MKHTRLIFFLLGVIVGFIFMPRQMTFEFGSNHRDTRVAPSFSPRARMRDGGALVFKSGKTE